jgi:hypothetical protein
MTQAQLILTIAKGEVGVMENGRNRGPRVEEYLDCVGLEPGNPWCAAFVSWVLSQAGEHRVRAGGALKLYARSPVWSTTQTPTPGSIFVIDHGGGLGHCGFVDEVCGDELITIEGNTNPGGSREGDGVYIRTRRRAEINRGFIDLSLSPGSIADGDIPGVA